MRQVETEGVSTATGSPRSLTHHMGHRSKPFRTSPCPCISAAYRKRNAVAIATSNAPCVLRSLFHKRWRLVLALHESHAANWAINLHMSALRPVPLRVRLRRAGAGRVPRGNGEVGDLRSTGDFCGDVASDCMALLTRQHNVCTVAPLSSGAMRRLATDPSVGDGAGGRPEGNNESTQ